jgi:hypothetical protein
MEPRAVQAVAMPTELSRLPKLRTTYPNEEYYKFMFSGM